MDSRLYSKCIILNEVKVRYEHDPMWEPFFRIFDVALPLARLVVLQCAEATDTGEQFINEAWLDLCKIVMVDPDGEYDFLDEMLVIGAD